MLTHDQANFCFQYSLAVSISGDVTTFYIKNYSLPNACNVLVGSRQSLFYAKLDELSFDPTHLDNRRQINFIRSDILARYGDDT